MNGTDVFCAHCGRELPPDEVREIEEALGVDPGVVLGVVGRCCRVPHPTVPGAAALRFEADGPWYLELAGVPVPEEVMPEDGFSSPAAVFAAFDTMRK